MRNNYGNIFSEYLLSRFHFRFCKFYIDWYWRLMSLKLQHGDGKRKII